MLKNSELTPWQSLSDRELEAMYLTACVENIQWLIGSHRVESSQLVVEGWAISKRTEQARFLINGEPFDEVYYPLPSPDLADIFWNTPTAGTARFVVKTQFDHSLIYPDGFARLEFLAEEPDREPARHRAWYLPSEDLPVPAGERIYRVIGVADSVNYLIGGATIYKRFEYYLQQKFAKTFKDFNNILDWGCGSGRVSRYFRQVTSLQGVDIDGDNIQWCQTHLPHGQFSQIPLQPPMSFPAQTFDLIIGISVLTHLSEEHQFAWLQELKRIAKKDALLILSVQGLSQMGLYRPPPALLRDIETKGFLVTGRNSNLDAVMTDKTYYIDVIQSRDYLYTNWTKYFTIIDIVNALAANQDIVVMKNDKS